MGVFTLLRYGAIFTAWHRNKKLSEYFRKFNFKQFPVPYSVGDPVADAGEQELRRKHRIQFLNLFIRAVKPQFSVIEDTALPGKGIGKE